MKILSKAAAFVALVVALIVPTGVAGAETCTQDYCKPTVPNVGGTDGEVGSGGAVRDGGAEVDAGGATTGGAAGAQAEASAPSGSLPITGTDVAQLAAVGVAAVGIGALFVSRSRRGARIAA